MNEAIKQENRAVIDEMNADGIDLTQKYTVEHHFSGHDFKLLEKLAVAVYELGFEVTDAEEFRDERNRTVFCFDAYRDMIISAEELEKTQDKFLPLLTKFHAFYDGWGVPMEDEEDFVDDEVSEEAGETAEQSDLKVKQ